MTAVVPLPPLLKQGITAVRALQELGPRQILAYSQYRTSLRLGIAERLVQKNMQSAAAVVTGILAQDMFALPSKVSLYECIGTSGLKNLLADADEICAGQVRLFGGDPVPLQLVLPGELKPWIKYEGLSWLEGIGDIKFAWEPARFGWAVILARAYHASTDARYAEAFWHWTEIFFNANPPGMGPQWVSAQEVALRLICLVFAWQIFARAPESSPERAASLARWIAIHAARIPPTLNYARAQNNNHLLSEAAGLFTASLALPKHPQAQIWRELGWRWLNQGLLDQIDREGVHSQHSTNYYRLVLQLALWVYAIADRQRINFPLEVQQRLSAATGWLAALLDIISGKTPNLGPNDGAYIFPLSTCAFSDYRPVLQAAGIAFEKRRFYPKGDWDEMSLWYGLNSSTAASAQQHLTDKPAILSQDFKQEKRSPTQSPAVLRSSDGRSRAYLRAAHFSGRPGHADQLHFDLWQGGLNLALDAGTYLYNAPPPWDNSLAQAFLHNTVTLDGQDQMVRAGRFLYLRRAQAEITEYLFQPEKDWERLVARHNGYRHLGRLHVRQVERLKQNWQVRDQIIASRGQDGQPTTARLHWLLPDWSWELQETNAGIVLSINNLTCFAVLQLTSSVKPYSFSLVRAGECLAGTGEAMAILGWHSPTYGLKLPALSLSFSIRGILPLEINTAWNLEEA